MIGLPGFDSGPDSGKVARAGSWETAVEFRAGDLIDHGTAASLVGDSTEVACEAFFGAAFIGLRRLGTPEELAGYVTSFAECVRRVRTGAEFVMCIQSSSGVRWPGEFRHAEVGAEGAWHSVGAYRIEDPACALADYDAVWPQVLASPVGCDTTHPKALEFSFDNGFGDGSTHWIALPVSDRNRLRRTLLRSALRVQLALLA